MKSKQKEELKGKSIEELKNSIKELHGLLFKLRIEKAQNKMKNLKSIFFERKKIALMSTIINEKLKLEKVAETKKEEKKTESKSKKKEVTKE